MEDVTSHLDTLTRSLEASEEGVNVDSVVRSIAVQSLLHIGSRSVSHLLNAIERYLPFLRHIASGSAGRSLDAKMDVLNATAAFWARNRQMIGIVFDKLMQYQIINPNDIVEWTFANSERRDGRNLQSLTVFGWDLAKAALDKANGRVMIARRKVLSLIKEDDDTRAREKAKEATSMEVDGEDGPGKLAGVLRVYSLTESLVSQRARRRESCAEHGYESFH